MTAMPLMVGVLCAMAIAYRYYSAFLTARVAALDDSRTTPAVRLDDGQNYHPAGTWGAVRAPFRRHQRRRAAVLGQQLCRRRLRMHERRCGGE